MSPTYVWMVGVLWMLVSCSRRHVYAQKTCTKVNSCKCSFGDGTVIDLTPVGESGKAKFPDQWDTNFIAQYSYNPCQDFSEGTCSSVSVCQYTGSDYYECGKQSSAAFVNDPNNPSVVNVVYSATGGDGVTRTSQVTLNCVESGPDSLDVLGESPSTPAFYLFQLNSVHCCPKKGSGAAAAAAISVGSILVIM
ncbi:cation-dependent mannose-6-phosphate receptor-like isoform x1 [Plakobranchus ocellatus]|uniref:Cation-dependent mannose-6-phosphate receptor-like isoform x1 n=1 Tax=Plakobranchus ocellatus TaxID=259542 RepID=A0AAV4E1Z4_9GAST|nr:cation-dependent mannose-6-phosphate receptor-like isoform x1 [Plakobranchus ocellatus]